MGNIQHLHFLNCTVECLITKKKNQEPQLIYENENIFGPDGCKVWNKQGEDTLGAPLPAPFSLLREALGGQQEPPLLATDIRFPVPELHRIPFTGYKAYEKKYYPVKNSTRYQLCWEQS